MKHFKLSVALLTVSILFLGGCKKVAEPTGDVISAINSNTYFAGVFYILSQGFFPEIDTTIALTVDSSIDVIIPEKSLGTSISFYAPNANVKGIGYCFGEPGDIHVYEYQTGVIVDTLIGKVSKQIAIPPFLVTSAVCNKLAKKCHDVPCYIFAITTDGKISKPVVKNFKLICGTCKDAECKPFLPDCANFTNKPGSMRFNLVYSRGATCGITLLEPNGYPYYMPSYEIDSSKYGAKYIGNCDCDFCPNGREVNVYYDTAPSGTYSFYVNGSTCLTSDININTYFRLQVFDGGNMVKEASGTINNDNLWLGETFDYTKP